MKPKQIQINKMCHKRLQSYIEISNTEFACPDLQYKPGHLVYKSLNAVQLRDLVLRSSGA